jgi:hypothetical protein
MANCDGAHDYRRRVPEPKPGFIAEKLARERARSRGRMR